MELPLSQYPYPNDTTISGFLESAQTSLHNFGIVGVHEASVLPRTLQVYDALADARRLSLRVYAMLECETRNSFCLHDQVPDHRRQIPEPHYKKMGKTGHPILRSVKLFADGALGSRGAALLEPYSDDPTTSGTLLVEPPELKRVAGEWIRAGWQVNIHAIGDRANRAAVDALIEGLGSLCQSGESEEERLECILSHQRRLRCRIEHAQIVSPEDQVRIHKYGIIASIQPTHAISDSRYAEDRLGPERLESSAYRIKTFLQNKGRIVLGSDFPVESPDVVAGMRAAVLRKDVEGREFLKEEGIDWDSALKGFTTGPAYGAGLEKVAGTIECGKWADWVVVRDVKEWYGKEKPILEQEQGEEKLELAKIESGYGEWQIRETWTRGKRVYKKESEVEVEA